MVSAITGAFDIGLLIIGAMVLGSVAILLRQPLILAYIVTGVILGSQGLGLIGNEEFLTGISELGIAFLLFVVGLELSFKKILEVKDVVTFGTVATSVIMFIAGLFSGYFLGMPFIEGVYIGLVLAFSSTLLIVKTLGEKNQVDTLPGRIMIGTLVFQDLLVIIAVSLLGIIGGAEPTGFVNWIVHLPGLNLLPYIENIALLVGAILLLGGAWLVNRFLVRYLFRFFSHSVELLFVSSLGFFFAVSFAATQLGFSLAIGAFLSGVIVANTDYYLEILSKVRVLAVFFSVLFFATLGFAVTFESFTTLLIPIAIISALTLLLKPLVTGIVTKLFGYDNRTTIITSLHMSQVSEFSLIIVATGVSLGQIGQSFVTVTVISLLLTMTVSSYFMKYAGSMTSWLERRFRSLAPDERAVKEAIAVSHANVVVYGIENIDEQLLTTITEKHHALVIDPDPVHIDYLRKKHVPCLLGSLGNEEIIEQFDFTRIKLVISTIPNFEENLFLASHIYHRDPSTIIIMPARRVKEAIALYEHGASYVLVTSFADDHTIQSVLFNPELVKLSDLRKKHLDRLSQVQQRRKEAVDIDDFMSALIETPLKPVRRVFGRKRDAEHRDDPTFHSFKKR